MFEKIKKIFKKEPKEIKKQLKEKINIEEPLVLKKKPFKKETKETKSSLTFGV